MRKIFFPYLTIIFTALAIAPIFISCMEERVPVKEEIREPERKPEEEGKPEFEKGGAPVEVGGRPAPSGEGQPPPVEVRGGTTIETTVPPVVTKPSGVPSGPTEISIIKTPQEKESSLAAITDWQNNWNTFTAKARGLGLISKSGELYSTPGSGREAKIVAIVSKIPLNVFATEPIEGLKVLKDVAVQASNMFKANEFGIYRSLDYNNVLKAINDKVSQIVNAGDFSVGWADVSGDLATLSALYETIKAIQPSGIPGESSQGATNRSLEQNILTAAQKSILSISPKSLGSSLAEQANNLAAVEQAVIAKFSDKEQQAVLSALSQKIVSVFQDSMKSYSEDFIKALPVFSKSYAIVQQSATLRNNPAAVDQMIQSLTPLINSISGTPEEKVASLLSSVAASKSLAKQPAVLKVIASQIESLVAQELSSPSLKSELLASYKPEQAEDAYSRQLKFLTSYLKFSDSYRVPVDPATRLAAARRAVEITDFIEASKPQDTKERTWSEFWAQLFDWSSKFSDIVEKQDPSWWAKEQQLKKLYSDKRFYALPEDMINSVSSDLEKLASLTEPSLERKSIYEKLKGLQELLADPDTLGAFSAIPNAQIESKKITEKLKEEFQKEVGQKKAIQEQANKVIENLGQMTDFENIDKSKTALEEAMSAVDSFVKYTLLSGTSYEDLISMRNTLQSWSDGLDIMSSYQKGIDMRATAENASSALVLLQKTIPTITSMLNYKNQESFTEQLKVMKQQLGVLDKISTVLSQPVFTVASKTYTLSDVRDVLNNFYENGVKPSDEVWKTLSDHGLVSSGPLEIDFMNNKGEVQQVTRDIDTVTDKGNAIISMGRQGDLLDRRVAQLKVFTKAYTSDNRPPLVVTNLSGREIGLATTLKLGWLIPDDELAVLKDVYNRYYLGNADDPLTSVLESASLNTKPEQKAQEAQAKSLAAIAANKNLLLADISDYLELTRTLSEKADPKLRAVNPYFEAVVIEELKLQDPNLTEKQKQAIKDGINREGMTRRILALSDPQAFLDVQVPALLQETKAIFREAGSLFGEAYNAVTLPMRGWKWQAQKKLAVVLWWTAIPAGIATFFTVEAGARVGAPTIASILSGPIGGALVSKLANTLATDIIAMGSGVIAGVGTAYAAYKTGEDAKKVLEELNRDRIKAGWKPIEIEQDKWLMQKALEKVGSMVSSEVNNQLKEAENYRFTLNQKEQTFEQARAQFLDMLGLTPEASSIDVKEAIAKKKAELDKNWGINRWLITRRFNNAYNFMTATGRDMVEAHQTYNEKLASSIIKQLATIQKTNLSMIASMLQAGMDIVTGARNFVVGLKDRKLSEEEFSTLSEELLKMYKSNVADLIAFRKILDKNAKLMRSKKTTIFGDSTLIDTIKLLIDRQQQLITQSYSENVDYLFKASGLPSAKVERQKVAAPGS